MSWKLLISILIVVGLTGPIAILITNLVGHNRSVIGFPSAITTVNIGDCRPDTEEEAHGNTIISCKAPSTVDSELAKLVGGSAAFNAPDHATIGKSQVVEARLSMSEPPSQLMSELPGSGRKESASLKVGKKMSATLSGGGSFDIFPSGPQVQLISSKDTTVWEWTITPKIAGTQFLILSFDALLTVDGKEGTRTINVLIRKIDVQVAWPETLQDWLDYVKGMYWLWATILLPIGAYIIHKCKKTGDDPKKAHATAPPKAASLGLRRGRKSRG